MVERREVEAALAARHELGREYEPEIVDSLVEKIERRLDERRPAPRQEHQGAITPLLLGSVALGIPVTAVSLSNAPGVGGIVVAVVAWLAIGAANVTLVLRRFR